MAELPTQKQLEEIFQEKGYEPLIWYAWRSILRVTPLIGGAIVKQESILLYYSAARVLINTSNWNTYKNSYDKIVYNCYNESGTVTTGSQLRYLIVSYIYKIKDLTDLVFGLQKNKEFNKENFLSLIVDVNNLPSSIVHEVKKFILYNDIDNFNQYANDFDFLLKNIIYEMSYDYKNIKYFHSAPLWKNHEPDIVTDFYSAFHKLSAFMKIGFLEEDIKNLIKGKELGKHKDNYLKNWSLSVISEAQQLKRAILLGHPSERIHAVRVLLLGSGGAGKSSLADRLQGKPVQQYKPLTIGVDYLEHQPLNLKKVFQKFELLKEDLDLYLWDFGGQTIFHGLHSAFLHENCVYVLVVDSRHEQAPDDWLYQIRHLAGSQAKVLLVTNWYEQCESQQNHNRLLREFPDLLTEDSFFYFSCLNEEALDFKRFVQALVKTSLDSQRMVLKETLDVQRELERQYEGSIFLHEADIKTLIQGIIEYDESGEKTINQLNQLGFLVRVVKQKNRYCLKPAWAVDNAYRLLYSEALRRSGGVADMLMLEQVLAGKETPDHIEYLVEFLNERGLCCLLGNSAYFFPDAAPPSEPQEIANLLSQRNKLSIRFDLPYLPLGFHARLVHRLFSPEAETGIRCTEDIWRQGFIIKTSQAQAVIQYLSRKSSIELVMTGYLSDFSLLLNKVYNSLKDILVQPNGLRLEQLHVFIVGEAQQLISIHSSEELVRILRQIRNYDQLFEEIKRMSEKGTITINNNGQMALGNSNTINENSNNVIITIAENHKQILSKILEVALQNKNELPNELLRTIFKTQDIIELDAKQPTAETQSKIAKAWQGLQSITDFTNNSLEVGGKVSENWPAITAWLASLAAIIGS